MVNNFNINMASLRKCKHKDISLNCVYEVSLITLDDLQEQERGRIQRQWFRNELVTHTKTPTIPTAAVTAGARATSERQ